MHIHILWSQSTFSHMHEQNKSCCGKWCSRGGCMVLKKVVWVALTAFASNKLSMCTITPLCMMKYELVVIINHKIIHWNSRQLSVTFCLYWMYGKAQYLFCARVSKPELFCEASEVGWNDLSCYMVRDTQKTNKRQQQVMMMMNYDDDDDDDDDDETTTTKRNGFNNW